MGGKFEMKNKRLFIAIGAALLLSIVLIVMSLYSVKQSDPDTAGTGGAGQPPQGTVILQNMDSSSTDNIPLSRFVSIKQNQMIRDNLAEVLQKEPKTYSYYNASITDGSVVVNYDTNVVSFGIKVEENNTSYKGTLNTVTDELHFYSADDKLLK